MLFSSLSFLFLFLPLNLLAYFFAKDIKTKNTVMLIFSLIFYAWGEPVYILLLVLMTLVDWYLSILVEKNSGKSLSKLFLGLAVGFDLTMLAIFKYSGFILSNFKFLFGVPAKVPEILLPIGISFYTFQLLTYCVDVYRGEVKAQRSFKLLLLYVSMFHQCIAGPIVRYKDICNQLTERNATYTDVADGISRFVIGLAKKSVLANSCAQMVAKLLVSDDGDFSVLASRSVLSLWLGVLMFSLQIYLDFSAYSDMAIGMGRMIGIHYNENFNYPYISRSVTEFWRRWHISLGSFFRDYVYIPLGGNRKGAVRTVINLFVVWLLTGLWHGASWNFVLWGLFFFVFITLEKRFFSGFLKKNSIISHIYLILVVYFGWILFKFDRMSDVLCVLKGMFGANANKFNDFETATVFKSNFIMIAICIFASLPFVSKLAEKLKYSALESGKAFAVYSVCKIVIPICLYLLSVLALVGNTYNPFLYFRF